MNRMNFYFLVLALLLCSNIILLYFLQKPHNKVGPDGPRNAIIKRLNFDEQQIADYDTLISAHRKIIRNNNDKITSLKQALYSTLPQNSIDSLLVDSLVTEIGHTQRAIELIHFNHFRDIKKLCKDTQLGEFGRLSEDLQSIFPFRRNENKGHK